MTAVLSVVTWMPKAEGRKYHDTTHPLSIPITLDDIAAFTKRLVAVSFHVGGECWLMSAHGKRRQGIWIADLNTCGMMRFHGIQIATHRFAYAAAHGIPIHDLSFPRPYDIHHGIEFGDCVGIGATTPTTWSRLNTGRRADAGEERKGNADWIKKQRISTAKRQHQQIEEVLSYHPAHRGPEEFRAVRQIAGRSRRFFAGLPFLIRLGTLEEIVNPSLDYTHMGGNTPRIHRQQKRGF